MKVSDRVRIKEGTLHYGYDNRNPADVEGTIIDSFLPDSNGYKYRVQWDNNTENTYRDSDLELVKLELFPIY